MWVISWQLHIRSYGISLHITYRTISIHREETIKHAEWGFLRYANCCYIKSMRWRTDTEEVQLKSTCHKSLKVHWGQNPAAALPLQALSGDDFMWDGAGTQLCALWGFTSTPHGSSSHLLVLCFLGAVPHWVLAYPQAHPNLFLICFFLKQIGSHLPFPPSRLWVWLVATSNRLGFVYSEHGLA